ncbi:hypothetical protein [Donghicola tyrosinivorans]|nr:hypothetical protein [Donghicola tyrosinivorans]
MIVRDLFEQLGAATDQNISHVGPGDDHSTAAISSGNGGIAGIGGRAA